MLQKLLQTLKDKSGQDWLEYGILAGGVALVGLAATGTLGHRLNKRFAVVPSVPAANSGANSAVPNGKVDAGKVVAPMGPTAADGVKVGDDEDGL